MRNAVVQKKKERKTKEEEEEEEEAHFGEERRAETSLLSAAIVPHIKNARNICTSEKNSFRSHVKREVLMEGQKRLSRLSRRDFVGYVSANCHDTFVIAKLRLSHDRNYRKGKIFSCHKLNVFYLRNEISAKIWNID